MMNSTFFFSKIELNLMRIVGIDILTWVINCAINFNNLKENLIRNTWKLWRK